MTEISTLIPFEGRYIKNNYEKSDEDTTVVRSHPGKCLLPTYYSEIGERILAAPVRESDVWLISFPRTGSTWCQEMIWIIGNDLDYETAKNTMQQVRAPLIESSVVLFEYADVDTIKIPAEKNILPPKLIRLNLPFEQLPVQSENGVSKVSRLFTDPVGYVEDLPSPRYIKSHLPIELLPEKLLTVKPKVIYTMRNPKDLCVSYYYHCRMVHKLNIDFETFCELFLNDSLPIGSVFNHYFGFWNRRHEPNILIIRYEEMKADSKTTVKRIAEFLGKSLTDEDVNDICEFLSFQNMRENKACNLQVLIDSRNGNDFYEKSGVHFIRKGIVGDHKNHMSEEMIKRFDKWIEQNTKGTDLAF